MKWLKCFFGFHEVEFHFTVPYTYLGECKHCGRVC